MKRINQKKLRLNIQLFADTDETTTEETPYYEFKDIPSTDTPLIADTLNGIQTSIKKDIKKQVSDTSSNFSDIIEALDSDVANIKNIMVDNAGCHASHYRGKDITTAFYNGTVTTNIKNGTFKDIFVGDYIIGKISKRKYIVADIDYYLYTGDTECTTHHLVMVPEQVMGNARMNATNTTEGAYVGSEMYKTNLASYKSVIEGDFGSDHMLTHRNIFANAVKNEIETAGAWANSCVELMNELNVYGSNIVHNVGAGTALPYNYEVDNSQFALFKFDRTKLVAFNGNNRQWYWLRSVANSASFADVSSAGHSDYIDASLSGGVRPAFTIY